MNWKRLCLCSLAAVSLLVPSVALSQSSDDYKIGWFATAGGGGSSAGATYRVQGTVGQSIAHTAPATGGGYRVQGGFWAPFAGGEPPTLDFRVFLPLVTK
jgi:hypothetical protein